MLCGYSISNSRCIPVIEEPETATVIPAGSRCHVDEFGNFLIIKNGWANIKGLL